MDIAFGRDLAIIWLSLFCLVGLCIPIVGLFFAVRGMNGLQKRSKQWLQEGHTKVISARQQTEELSDKVVQPIIQAQSRVTQAKTSIMRITGRN